MKLTADPMEEAIKLGVRFDESKIQVLVQMIVHALFLGVFCTALFVRMDLEQPYRMQYASKEVLHDTAVIPKSTLFFPDINTVPQIFDFVDNVLLTSLYQQSFYNGVPYPATSVPADSDDTAEPYSGYFFEDSSLTLGTVRVRQVRSETIPCTSNANSTSFLSIMGDCHAHYVRGVTDVQSQEWEEIVYNPVMIPDPACSGARRLEDAGADADADAGADACPDIESEGEFTEETIKHKKVANFTTSGEYAETFEWRSESSLDDDVAWQSPVTLITYDAGGFVVDLPAGKDKASARMQELFESGFVDTGTRALFFDYSLYNANNDQFLSCRILFELMPTGAIVPFTELIPAALLTDVRAFEGDNSSTSDLVQVIFEFLLYVIIIAYLTRASDDIAEYSSFSAYLMNPWNTLDLLNVACFLAVIAIRVFWMILSAKLQYGVGNELSSDDAADMQ
jgi:hypothetical protein